MSAFSIWPAMSSEKNRFLIDVTNYFMADSPGFNIITKTQRDKYTDIAVLGFIGGFVVMMILDVGLS